VGDGFVECDGRPAGDHLAGPTLDGARPLTGRTGQLTRELLGLSPDELFEGAASESATDGSSDLFHLVEVHIEIGAILPIGSVGNNLAPLLGQVLQCRELLG
jgi:hypothetical protein